MRRFLEVSLLLWLVTLVASWIQKDVMHLPASTWYPFFRPEYRFTDLTLHQERFRYLGTPAFFAPMGGFFWAYPALVAFAYQAFFLFGKYAVGAFLAFCLAVFGAAAVLFARALLRAGLGKIQAIVFVGLSLPLSYPFLYLMDRANMEILNWLWVALGVTAYWKRKWYLAGAFFGIAIAFKIFPFVFLGLLLSARKYGAILCALSVCAFTFFASTWLLGPTFPVALAGVSAGMQDFQIHYTLKVDPHLVGFDHSLFAIVKLATFQDKIPQSEYYLPLLRRYMLASACGGLLLYFSKIRKLPRTNQVLALTVASILLPPVSYEYTLLHLYIPWALLALMTLANPESSKLPGMMFSFVCMAYLMAPESYLVLQGVRFAGQMKAIALLALFLAAISYPFPEMTREHEPKLVDAG